ncbi:MAG: malate dehydrogenase [Thermonemataceae bacterium]|nr:malate dehydrogenase [Thermonemataceae bacterium]
MKATVIGAGNVGATTADVLAYREIVDEVVLLDIKEGISEGKALDMLQATSLTGTKTRLVPSFNDYTLTANSDVVVITSGLPRKPGMTREELIGVNAGIVKSVVEQVVKHSPNAILIIVSNPMDTMTYLTHKVAGIAPNRIIGLGGVLDSARFTTYLASALACSHADIQAVVVGGHGDTTMIPLTRLATYKGVPVGKFLSEEALQKIAADTMVGGATLTKLIGTSAWYAPGAAAAALVETIVRDQKRVIASCVPLNGEYGQNDICMGVPVVIGKNGWERIIDFELNADEQAMFAKSAEAVRNMNNVLATLSL